MEWLVTMATAWFTANQGKMGSSDWWCGDNSLFGCPEWLYPSHESHSENNTLVWAVAGLAIFAIIKD